MLLKIKTTLLKGKIMSQEEQEKLAKITGDIVKNDVNNILDSLILYKTASKVLSKEEMNNILETGKKKFLHFIQNSPVELKGIEEEIENLVNEKIKIMEMALETPNENAQDNK